MFVTSIIEVIIQTLIAMKPVIPKKMVITSDHFSTNMSSTNFCIKGVTIRTTAVANNGCAEINTPVKPKPMPVDSKITFNILDIFAIGYCPKHKPCIVL